MNVSELKRAVLRNLNEKDDEQTLAEMGEEILSYINEAYLTAAVTKLRPVKRSMCEFIDGKFSLSEIPGSFIEVKRVLNRYGVDVKFTHDDEYVYADDGIYEVEYVYIPDSLYADEDVPIINRAFHYILSDYGTYRMFLKGSKARQSRGDAFLSSYLNGLSKMSDTKNTYIRNKYGSVVNG